MKTYVSIVLELSEIQIKYAKVRVHWVQSLIKTMQETGSNPELLEEVQDSFADISREFAQLLDPKTAFQRVRTLCNSLESACVLSEEAMDFVEDRFRNNELDPCFFVVVRDKDTVLGVLTPNDIQL